MCLAFMQSEHMKSFYFRFTPSSSSFGRWTQETAAAVGGVTGEVAGCSSARSRPRLRCTGRRGVLAAGLMTPWSGHGWPARQLQAAAADRARCRERRGATSQGRGGWLRSCRGWQRWAEQLEKGGGEEHGGYRLLKNEEAPDGLAWFLAADGERRGREWRGGCCPIT